MTRTGAKTREMNCHKLSMLSRNSESKSNSLLDKSTFGGTLGGGLFSGGCRETTRRRPAERMLLLDPTRLATINSICASYSP